MVTTYIVKRVGLIHMPTQKLTPEILTAAIEGFEQQKLRIDAQIAKLRIMLPGGRSEPAATPEAPKRKLSDAGRRAIGEATKKRWAASHAAKHAEKPAVAKKRAAKKTAAKNAAVKAPVKVAAKKPAVKKPQKKVTKAPEAAAPVAAQ